MVIENLRAKALMEVSVRPDLVKLDTQLHRRCIEKIELIARLKGMRAIEMVATVSPVKALAHSSSPSLEGKGKGNGKADREGAGA